MDLSGHTGPPSASAGRQGRRSGEVNEGAAVRPGEPAGTPSPARSPDGWRIEVEIGELVLTGVRRADRDRVVAAFQRELARLLRSRGLPATSSVRDAVTGLPPLPVTTSPYRLGHALARAVHAGLSDHGTPAGGPEAGR